VSRSGLFPFTTSNKGISVKMLWKINIIEIIIPLISWLDFVICGFIKNFLPNSYFILQIYHAKSFKMRHVSSLYFFFSKIFIKCFKNSLFLSRPDFQYAPLTYSLCFSGHFSGHFSSHFSSHFSCHFSDNFDAHTEIQTLKGVSLILIL